MADQTGFGRQSRLGTILLPVIGVIRRIGSEIDPNFASVTKRQNMSALYTIVNQCDNVSFSHKNCSAFSMIGCSTPLREKTVLELGTENNQYWENRKWSMLTDIDASLGFKFLTNTRFCYVLHSTQQSHKRGSYSTSLLQQYPPPFFNDRCNGCPRKGV